jgi:hypothetical protein
MKSNWKEANSLGPGAYGLVLSKGSRVKLVKCKLVRHEMGAVWARRGSLKLMVEGCLLSSNGGGCCFFSFGPSLRFVVHCLSDPQLVTVSCQEDRCGCANDCEKQKSSYLILDSPKVSVSSRHQVGWANIDVLNVCSCSFGVSFQLQTILQFEARLQESLTRRACCSVHRERNPSFLLRDHESGGLLLTPSTCKTKNGRL